MNEIAKLMAQLAPKEGVNDTYLSGVRVFRGSQYASRGPLCYSQGVLIVGQGKKRVYIEDQTFDYDRQHSLVMTVPLPVECETFASIEEPVLVLMVDINLVQLNYIVRLMDEHHQIPKDLNESRQSGFFIADSTEDMDCSVIRLLQALQSPLEAQVMGEALVLELLYRLLDSPNAAPLYALSLSHTRLSRVEKALSYIHKHYGESVEVDTLAGLVNMSPSAFHRCFKEVTSSTPIQYVKKIRLNKARELLQLQKMKVKEVSIQVGYESTAQFSREFKRYFEQSPGEFARL
ncbi:AraC family transcriptional regulator [Shewanella inventionis]|uniref:XRE family transcriptional regulator n=1 Tax=Shewanella inventionis TaxID=1738770 RepID=A0ABQ1JRH5_9GAMM|nr:AraC family transcriptional regulator [Shewanella inventionis]MCL1159480.1 AraC family transcriptional regulator [Shewanella inventionis]UAL43780.1 AraC family transcriptional regulator [Shewanella inventionis]GGB72942.1 XRE family transcriptional regulator [Shewanella inventionis]